MNALTKSGIMPCNPMARLSKQKYGFHTLMQTPAKKSSLLLKLNRNDLSRLVQFLTGHNKLKRHKNIQAGIIDPHSCRLCLEDDESSFHVIAECPAM